MSSDVPPVAEEETDAAHQQHDHHTNDSDNYG